MRSQSFSVTPFEKGKNAAKAGAAHVNPYADGTVEHRNYELGRVFAIRHFKLSATHDGVAPRA